MVQSRLENRAIRVAGGRFCIRRLGAMAQAPLGAGACDGPDERYQLRFGLGTAYRGRVVGR